MQSSPPPPKQGEASSRKKKHKSLDDICDSVYKQHHHGCEAGPGPGSGGGGGGGGGGEAVRRSSRARRPPVMLDLTPKPPKKRRRVDRSRNVKVEEEVAVEEEDEGGWRSRLRDRRKRKGKRKLFEENGEGRERPRVVKSKRPGRVRARNGGKSEGNELHVVKDENVEEEEEEDAGNERESVEGDSSAAEFLQLVEEEEEEEEEECIGNEDVGAGDCVENMEITNGEVEQLMDVVEGRNDGEQMGLEQVECVAEGEGQREGVEAVGALRNEECVVEGEDQREGVEAAGAPRDEECAVQGDDKIEGVEAVGASRNEEEIGAGNDGKGSMLTKDDENLAVEVNDVTVNKFKLGKPRIKQGRHCGLCGGGTDGMPPKILDQDTVENENEAYVGSSDSEKFDYNMWDGFGDEPGWLGRLLGPIIDRYGIAGTWVHQNCAVWSPEVYFAGVGCLKNIRAALCRGRALKCTRCGRPGATIGCRVDRCSRTYHLPCARAMGCIFDHRKFLIACTGHRKLFQPLGYQYLIRKKKLKTKKMKLEIRKVSNDAWRKDIEAEEKWLEKCGDDEEFLKRESKRLHRDLVRIAPVYIGGSDFESGKLFQGWESVAGLENVIRCMKEVVILPLLYPEFFDSLSLTPPRGVLLHGYPGTGKTLVVRALIGACARGDKRIAYFARKGADCLGKYVGDAERQLRLLFQVAEKCQPSIIFFDEIDGLAPSRTRQQDQTHSSVVSTLLALMDGLKSRGSVVVIGATNRPDAVDPALRRPGRFDREIYFPLPSEEDRASILSVHTKKWPKPVTGSVLKSIARGTAGFAGADLQALCTQAAIISLKRNFPLQEVLSAAGKKAPDSKRLPLPAFAVEDRDWLEALTCSPPPCSRREVGIAANDVICSPLPTHLIPCLLQPLSSMLVSLYLDERLWLPTPLRRAAKKIENVVVSALNKKKMLSDRWWSHIDVLLQEADVAKDIEKKLLHAGILLGDATVTDSEVCNDDVDERISSFEATARHHGGTRPSLLQSTSVASTNKPGFRILIAGNPRSGQRHLASCLLHCFVGNVEIQKVDLATLLLEGCGNMAQGITQILKKCASVGSCIVFMPRIDLWALEAPNEVTDESDSDLSNHQLSEKEKRQLPGKENSYHKHGQLIDEGSGSLSQQCNSEEMVECQDVTRSTSQAWNLFVEQVESLCVSASLMILATSEVPCPVLPDRIRQFFNTDISNGHRSVPVKHTVPRFSLQVNGNFDHDLVMNLSAAELSKEIVKQIVLLVHQTSHIHSTSYEDRDSHVLTGHSEIVDHSADHGSADINSNLPQCLDESLFKAPPPPTNILGNGKSSLMLAISSFGYQILLYPQFAELCWFTSKLKEGPSADISGPWKGWPFNSCIVRPNNSVEVAVAYTSPKVKSKENFGVVRGLIAVALSAYRGIYTSLREVTSEVRQVLEILVAQINAKIEAGKDRYQYVRLLSQVAYLEDVVYSWAYTLRSLELDAPLKMGNAKAFAVTPPDNDHMDTQVQPKVSSKCSNQQGALEIGPQEFNTMDDEISDLGNQVQSQNIKPNVSRKCSNEHVVLEIGPQAFDSERVVIADLGYSEGRPATVDCSGQGIVLPDSHVMLEIGPRGTDTERIVSIDIDEEVADLGCSEGRPATVDCSGQEIVLPEFTQDKDENLNDIGTNSKPYESESDKIDMVATRDSGSLKHPNGFECTESVAIREDGLTSDELCSIKLGRSGTISNKLNGLSPSEAGKHNGSKPDADECTLDVNFSSVASLPECLDKDVEFSNKTSLPECLDKAGADVHLVDGNVSLKTNLSSESGFVCSYHCCSECLETLHTLTQKILIEEWRSNKSQWTVDDVHDIVASLSADLLSAVKRIHVSGGFRNSFDDKSRGGHSESSERPESKPCDCKRLRNQILSPTECICHATSVSFPPKENASANMHFRFGSKFVFRDGVLVQMDPDQGVSFHCKFETLCLCSLIELIVMTKQPVH